MEQQIIDKMEESISNTLKQGLTTANLDTLYKLVKIKHLAKEDSEMYGNYSGRGPGHGAYGEYGRGSYGEYGNYGRDEYGRRGYDTKYRGYEHLDRISDHYGRYAGNRERYGNNEDTKRSLKLMLESMEDFARMLKEEAQSQEEVEMIRQTAQRIAKM